MLWYCMVPYWYGSRHNNRFRAPERNKKHIDVMSNIPLVYPETIYLVDMYHSFLAALPNQSMNCWPQNSVPKKGCF